MDSAKPTPAPETKLHFLDYWRIIRIRKTVILAVFLLVVITATLVTYFLPPTYSSTARIKVERDQTDIAGLTQMQNPWGYDPYFIQTEFEVIQSEMVLGKVIDDLKLCDFWGKKFGASGPLKPSDALRILRGYMNLKPVRNTTLIEITVLDSKPEEAARIANAIAKAYQEHRLMQRSRMSKSGIEALDKQRDEQAELIAKVQKEVDDLRVKLKISDVLANESAPTPLMTTETLRRMNQQMLDSEYQFNLQSTLLENIKNLTPKEQVEAIPTAAQDTGLTSLLEQKNIAEQRLTLVEKEYGEKHNETVKAKASVDELTQKVTDRVQGIIKGLQSRVDSQKSALDQLKADVQKALDTDIDTANRTRPYFEAKRKLDGLMRFSQMLDMKITSEKIDMALPKTGMVEIVDVAVPVFKAVKPNKVLNITLGVIIGLVVGVGLAFFIEYLDTSVKTIDDVERALQAPVLGVIPQNVGLIIDDTIESPHAEAYRVLRTNILFSRKDDKLNTIAVVSAGAGEGKSTTVFNLATVFAQNGQRVVIVDSDLRRPTLHKMVRVTNSIGLTNYLLKQNTLDEVIQTSPVPTLDFMASGKLPSSSLGILSSNQMRDLIGELKRRYDFVFFDSPPIMGVSDASILASAVDMTIQVIQYRRYPQPMNIRAKSMIEKVGGNLVGIVLNNINMSQDESYYYYSGYYHDYYYSGKEESGSKKKKKSGSPNGAPEKSEVEIKQKY